MMQRPISGSQRRKGFTLVELAVVIVIIGVLAAFGVPRFLQSVEKSKAAEAFNYCSAVQSAQERYLAQHGVYTNDVNQLDIKLPVLQYFALSNTDASAGTNGEPTFSVTLTRDTNTSSYGPYTVVWNQLGFDPASNIDNNIRPVSITQNSN